MSLSETLNAFSTIDRTARRTPCVAKTGAKDRRDVGWGTAIMQQDARQLVGQEQSRRIIAIEIVVAVIQQEAMPERQRHEGLAHLQQRLQVQLGESVDRDAAHSQGTFRVIRTGL